MGGCAFAFDWNDWDFCKRFSAGSFLGLVGVGIQLLMATAFFVIIRMLFVDGESVDGSL